MAEKTIQPYINVPFLPLETDGQHGSQFFSNVRQLQVGFGAKVFRVDRDGMWAGAETFAAAPWSVDWDGNMTANSITLTGYIPVGGALTDIGTGNITNTYIGANAIATGNIQAGAVTASKITVSSLSAISANIGTITAGSLSAITITGSTITGTTLTTANSGQRVVLTSTFASYYNSSGTNVVNTFASSSSFVVQTQTSSGSIFLDHGPSGTIAFLADGSLKAVFDGSGETFCPFTNGGIDLGAPSANWRNMEHSGIHVYQGVDAPITYWGQVSGTFMSPDNTSGWSVTKLGTGRYRINHSLGTDNYAAVANAIVASGSGAYSAKIESFSTSSFAVSIFDDTGTSRDADFMFICCVDPN